MRVLDNFFRGVGVLTTEQREEIEEECHLRTCDQYQDVMAWVLGRTLRMLFENDRTKYLKNENEELKKRVAKLEELIRKVT